MKIYDFSQSKLIQNQHFYNGKYTLQQRIVYLILLFLGANVLASLPITFVILFTSMDDIFRATMQFMQGAISEGAYNQFMVDLVMDLAGKPWVLLIELLGTAFSVAAVLIFALVIEKRSGASLGLTAPKKEVAITAPLGALLGVTLIALVVGICYFTNSITLQRSDSNLLWLVPFFFAFFVQGFSEELLFRGYIMTALLRWKQKPWLAVFVSALIFAVMHGDNNGLNLIGLVNLFLFGVTTALLTFRTGNLWMATTLHALWNFAQGNLFGISVSGTPLMPTLWSSTLVAGRDLTHGGAFGLEGGCVTTLILLLSLVVVLYLPSFKKAKPEILN